MKRLILFLLLFTPLAANAQTTYYIDYATGSNANNGTAKGTPWKSHPYMTSAAGCAGAPHAYSHVAGDRFIFKGGVSWPAACFQANIILGGSSVSVRDYYGVDQTWFTGGGFTRPKFDLGGTAPSTNGGLSGSHNVITVSGLFTEWDNIEIVGQFIVGGHASANSGYDCGLYFSAGGGGAGHLVHNIFFHDWVSDTTNIVNGWSNCAGGIGMNGSHYTVTDSIVSGQNSMDVTRGVQVSFGGCFNNSSGAQRNHCSYVGEGATSYFGPISDSEFDHITDAGTAQGNCTGPYSGQCTTIPPNGIHTNILSQFSNSSAAIYNNLIHDNSTGASLLVCSISSVYNNVMWSNHTPDIDIDTGTGFCPNPSTNTANVYNNTIECQSGDCVRVNTKTSTLGTLNLQNNHFIKDSGNPVCVNHLRPDCALVTNLHQSNNLPMNQTTATGQGYTVASKYQAAGDTTTFVGVNLTAISTGVLSALPLDAEGTPWFGATSVARPTGSTKWNPGAYQSPFSGGGTPPTVTVTAPAAGTISGTRTITVTASGGTISSIQPLVDGQAFGNACTASPCNVLWDTTKVGNGTHTVGGTATNGSGQGVATPVTVTVNNSTPGCVTSGATWTNTSFTSQTGAFTATFTVTPNGIPGAGTGGPVVALSDVAVSAYGDNAVLIRQSDNGFWEAFNGSTNSYAHTAAVSWIVGTTATFTLSPNIGTQTYSVQVTQGGVTSTIATNSVFRTTVANLAFWNLDPITSFALTVCNFTLGSTGVLTPTSFNFGNVNIGSNASQVFTLTNNGGSPLTISATSITPNPPFSATANTCTGSLASAATCQITVRFAPTSPSSFSGTIHMTTSGTVNDVTLSGTGSSLSPPSVPTGLTATPGGTSVVLNWTASTGTGPITYNASRGTTNGGPYTSITTGITSTTYTDPGLANGTYYYVVSATNSAGTSVNSAQASAVVAVSPVVVISPSPLNFGTVGTGASGSLNVNVSNTGNANLTLSCPGAVTLGGANVADFAITTNGCVSPVAAGSSFSLLITFTPTATGVENGTLCVTSNSATSPDCIAMIGVSQGFVTVSPTSLNFGSVYVRSGSSTRDVVITNNSGGTVTVSSVSVGTGEYSVTTTPATNCGGSIANAATCTAHVTFNPTSVGTKADTLTVTNSAATQTVPLTGKGTNRRVAKGLL